MTAANYNMNLTWDNKIKNNGKQNPSLLIWLYNPYDE